MNRDDLEPGFISFFEGDWKTRLDTCRIPGMYPDCSWDRRAAYLLWQALGNPVTAKPLPKVPPLPTPRKVQIAIDLSDLI